MKIELITEDFQGSSYLSIEDCPFARALNRTFPKSEIAVGGTQIIIDGRNYNFIHKNWNGGIVRALIGKANAGEQVSYTLEIPGL